MGRREIGNLRRRAAGEPLRNVVGAASFAPL